MESANSCKPAWSKIFLGWYGFGTILVTSISSTREDASSDGILRSSDLVTTPASCKSGGDQGCALNNSCSAPPGKSIVKGSVFDLDAVTSVTGSPTLLMLKSALDKVSTALSNEIGTGGKFDSGTGNFIDTLLGSTFDPAIQDKCFRYILVANNVGE